MTGMRLFLSIAVFSVGWVFSAIDARGADGSGFTISPSEGNDGTIYCAVEDTLYAVSVDGVLMWRHPAPGGIHALIPASSPDSTLYLLSGNTLSAITRSDSLLWEVTGAPEGVTAPALSADGVLYLPGRSEWTALGPGGEILWSRTAVEDLGYSAATVGPDDTVFFTGRNSPRLYALSPDGIVKWTAELGANPISPPSLEFRGRIYVLTASRLVSLNAEGTVRWSLDSPEGNTFTGAPVISGDGTVYVADEEGFLFAVSSTGQLIRAISTGAAARVGPLLGSDGMLYQCALNGGLFRVDPALGVSTLIHEAGIEIQAPPIITRMGRICFGMSGGVFHSFPNGPPQYSLPFTPWPLSDQNSRHTRQLNLLYHKGALTGRITVTGSGEPLADITVRISPGDKRAVTDSSGQYWIYGLEEGVYTVTAEGFGSIPKPVDGVAISRGLLADLDIALTRDRKWIRWTFPVPGSPRGTPVIGADGTVYLGDSSGRVSALYPDRTLRWCLETGSPVTPLVIGDDGGLRFGSADTLRVVDGDGKALRSFVAGGAIFPPAVGHDGTAFFGCSDGNLYAVDVLGALKWKHPMEGAGSFIPVIGIDGTLYAGLPDGTVLAIDSYGETKWNFSAGGPVAGSPIPGPNGELYIAAGKRLVALDPTGKPLWTYYLSSDITGGPVLGAEDKIYFAAGNELQTVSKGRQVWKYIADGTITSIPAVGSDGTVYFGTSAGRFGALTFEGYLAWRLTLPGAAGAGTTISPDGVIYFGVDTGILYAIQTRSYGYQPDAFWPCYGKNSRNMAAADPPAHAAILSGTVTDAAGATGIPGAVVRLTPDDLATVTDSRGNYTLFVPQSGTYTLETSASGWLPAPKRNLTIAADARYTVNPSLHRDTVWMKWKKFIQPYECPRGFSASPAIGSDGAILIGYGETLESVNPDGTRKWAATSLNYLSGSPTVSSDGTVFIGATSLYSFDSQNGRLNWSQTYFDNYCQYQTIALAADSVVYVTNSNEYDRFIRAVNPSTGAQKWRARGSYTMYAIYTPPVVGSDGRIYTGDHGVGLHTFSPDGNEKWFYSTPYDYVDTPPVIGPDNTVYVVQKDGKIHALDPDGKLKWKYQTNYEAYASPVIGPDNTLYQVDGRGVLSALDTRGTRKWSRTDLLACAVPALGSDSTLYVAGKEGKLLALALDGKLKWSYDLGSDIGYAPKLAPDGTLYLYCANGYLYALQTPSRGYPRERCWPCLFGNNRNTNYLAPESARGAISGAVTNEHTGAGVPNALVSISPGDEKVSTDAEGRFILPNLKPGGYTLSVSAPGYTGRENFWTEIIGNGTIELGFPLADIIVGIEGRDTPKTVSLLPNYPNPFNPSTIISFTLPARSPVRLTVYDATGRTVAELANRTFSAGNHTITWNATGCATGVYFCRIETGSFTQTRKMLFVK